MAYRSARRALTLLELLVAITIALAFVGLLALAFTQINSASDQAQARLDAMANARHAIETLTVELKAARMGPPCAAPVNLFTASNQTSASGNRINDDMDNQTDEEIADGLDNDGDWKAADDKHAMIGPAMYERGIYLGKADLGDGHVDEDNKFGSAALIFRTFPTGAPPSPGVRQVKAYIGSYDGESSVLILEVTTYPCGGIPVTKTAPLAFNVVSFTALFWNQSATLPRWETAWDAQNPAYYGVLPELPMSVYLSISVFSGTPVRAGVPPQGPIETVTLNTVVDIESVLADPRLATRQGNYKLK
ncbi:MAG: type II secretion system protein [bacterium]|nr:type II secretion system protein [Candidatus Sumerlaeota bacterium]